jgi:hypothetical protein
VKGLLARARKLRDRLGLDRDATVEAGISPEDLKQIEQDLEQAVSESRLEVSPEDFKVKAAKQGVFFPAIVNVALIVALVLGLGALYVLFQRGETQIAKEEGAAATAEGKLIAELKRQAEADLEAKNREIDSIQGRLADIERQRQELQAGMDARVKAREDELRAAIAAELDAEKLKLQGQGLSDEAIAKRLADLEAQKNAQSSKQLDAYKREAEEERARSEASLTALSAEYSANLQKANEDRQKVLVDSRQREEELRAQLAQSTAALETEKAKAEAALRDLAAQKEKEELASSQLVSLYAVARNDISARNYDKAVQSLKAIGSYVSQGEVAQLPAIAKRRDVDLFVVDVLTAYVEGEKSKATADTASLVALASQVADLKRMVAEADQLARDGRTSEAEKRYTEALAVLPEAARAQAYLGGLSREQLARTETLREWLTRAESAFAGKRFDEALTLWKGALSYLPESADRVRATVEGIAASGAEEAASRTRREQSNLAAPILAKAEAAMEAKAYNDALPLYLEIVATYPQAGQAARAVQGIGDAVRSLSEGASAERGGQEAELARQLDEVRSQLSAAAAGNADLTAKLDAANQRIRQQEADVAATSAKLAEAKARADAAEKNLADAMASGANGAAVTALTQERDAAVKALADAKASLAERDRAIADASAQLSDAEARAATAEKKLADAVASGATSAAVTALTQERDAAAKSLADAKTSLAAVTQQRDEAVRGLAEANTSLLERDQTIARLRRDLAAAQQVAGAGSTVAVPQAAVQAALAAASPAEKVLVEGLQADYAAYKSRMAALDAKTLAANVLEQGKALGYRNTFFATASMQKTFPGLGESLMKYDEWWKAEGRNQMVAIVTDLVAKPTQRERRTYLDSLLKKYAADPAMVVLLKKLEPLVGTN